MVDLDTEALLKCADEMCRNNLEEEYREMAAVIPKSAIHLFLDGGHPSIFSNAEKFSELVKRFIECTD